VGDLTAVGVFVAQGQAHNGLGQPGLPATEGFAVPPAGAGDQQPFPMRTHPNVYRPNRRARGGIQDEIAAGFVRGQVAFPAQAGERRFAEVIIGSGNGRLFGGWTQFTAVRESKIARITAT